MKETDNLVLAHNSWNSEEGGRDGTDVEVEESGDALRNVYVMGMGCMLLFAAYNTVQATDSTILSNYTGEITHITYDLGTVSLCIIYTVACPSIMFAPIVIHRLGEGPTMVFGALLYTTYMASLVDLSEGLVWASSVLVGIGAGMLWVAQGVMITKCGTKSNRGTLVGIFWSIFQISGICGYFGGYILYIRGYSYTIFYAISTILGILGALVLSYTTSMEEPKKQNSTKDPNSLARADPPSTYEDLLDELVRVALENRMWPFALALFWTGFELAYVTSSFSVVVAASSVFDDDEDDEATVLLVFTFWAICEVIGAKIFGRLSDIIGRIPVLLTGFIFYGTGLALTTLLVSKIDGGDEMAGPCLGGASWLVYVTAGLFGFADCAVNTQVYAFLGDIFPGEKSSCAFVAFQLLQNIGGAISYLLSVIISSTTYTLLGIQAIYLVLTMTFLYWIPNT